MLAIDGTQPQTAEKDAKTIKDAIAQSVVVNQEPYFGMTILRGSGYANTLPDVYDFRRQAYLGRLRYHPQNSLFQAAVSSISKQVVSASWEIKGNRRVPYFQDILQNADRGRGFESLLYKLLWDWFTLDSGAVVEVIGRGEADKPLNKALITGLGYLDPLRCHFTDNFEYPVIYQDYRGQLHKMHYTRVLRFVDQPLPYEDVGGIGFSALSRAIAWVQQAIVSMTYQGERLSNEPPPGIMLINGLNDPSSFDEAYKQYEVQRRNTASQYKPIMRLAQGVRNDGTANRAEIQYVRFSDAPEGFDPVRFAELQAKAIAASLNIDPQDIMPLQGGQWGVNTQAEILERKGSGKALAAIFKMIERALNFRVLPESLQFEFKHRDTQQSAEDAQTASLHMGVAEKLAQLTNRETAVRYLAQVDEVLRDAMTAPDGTLQRYDDDPESLAESQAQEEVITSDATEAAPDNTQEAQNAPQEGTGDENDRIASDTEEQKDYDDTEFGFSRDLYSAIQGADDQEVNRRRAGIVVRGLVTSYGRQAYKDGLEAGGVEVDTLEGDDLENFNRILREQSVYVTNMLNKLYSTDERLLSDEQLRAKIDMWNNKTLKKFYMEGLASADKNGMYVFGGPDGRESCPTCKRLKGQRHRMKEWTKRRLRPGVDTDRFECGGWHCDHELYKTTGRPRGRF